MNKAIAISTATWNINGIKAILFDKDGTFVDSNKYWGEIILQRSQALCEHFNLNPIYVERLQYVMGFSVANERLLSTGPIALVSRDEVIEIVTRYLASQEIGTENSEISKIFEYVHKKMEGIDTHIQLIPSALPLFKSLLDFDVKLAVVTTDALRNTELTLEKLLLKPYFATIVGRESCKEPKVSGVPAKIALSKLGISASDAVCVGDAPMDMEMALKSGCKASIGVATGQISESQLAKVTPYVVSSLSLLTVTQTI
jgi:phosphoglycolate phosphatase